jgi:hypothetical protein
MGSAAALAARTSDTVGTSTARLGLTQAQLLRPLPCSATFSPFDMRFAAWLEGTWLASALVGFNTQVMVRRTGRTCTTPTVSQVETVSVDELFVSRVGASLVAKIANEPAVRCLWPTKQSGRSCCTLRVTTI